MPTVTVMVKQISHAALSPLLLQSIFHNHTERGGAINTTNTVPVEYGVEADSASA